MTPFTKFFTASALLLFSQQAQALEFTCEAENIKPDVVTYIQHAPSYFTKAVPIPKADKTTYFKDVLTQYGGNWDLGTYIGDVGGDNNRIVILNKEESFTNGGVQSIEFNVPGPFDPVPSPDGRILSVASPMRLYDIREFLIPGHQPKALTEDLMDGVYQSIAWLRPGTDVFQNAMATLYPGRTLNQNQRLYRMVTDNASFIPLIDFIITYKPNCNVVDAVANSQHCVELEVLKPENQEEAGSWKQCGERTLKTLFISRKGTYLSGFSNEHGQGTSKILDISKPGSCPEVMDLGHPVGKIDFDEDEDTITFHIDYLNDHSGGYFSQVDGTRTKDIFLVDIEPTSGGKLKGKNFRRVQTTLTKGQGCYYPSFFNDGDGRERVLCMFDEGNEDERDGYSFRTTTYNNLRSSLNYFLPTFGEGNTMTAEDKVKLHNYSVLGLVWGKACNPADNDEYTAAQAATLFMNMKHEDCKKVAEHWGEDNSAANQLRQNLQSDHRFEDDPRFEGGNYIATHVTKNSLLRACGLAESYQERLRLRNNFESEIYGTADGGQFIRLTGEEIAQRKCTGCHHKGIDLNAVLDEDIDNGVQSFPSLFEFGGHYKVPLMYIDASLERMGYDPVQACELPGPLEQDQDILSYLLDPFDFPAESRTMPPVLRVQLTQDGDYDEAKILVEHLCEMRDERINEILNGTEEH